MLFCNSIKKRVLSFILTIFMVVVVFSGCKGKGDVELSVLIPLQKESFQKFFDSFTEKNKEVSFNFSAYHGGSTSAYLSSRFDMDDLTDIVITSYSPLDSIQKETLLDLSGYDFVHNYKASVLSNLDVDGRIYLLEGPTQVRGIAYNKTLFKEKGWDVPTNHDEFINLVKEIKKEGLIKPFGLQGKYPGTYFTLMTELSYCDYLQSPGGATFLKEYSEGNVSSSEGFSSGISILQEWLDAGVFDASQMGLGDSTLYPKFVKREYAMCYVMGSQNKLVGLADESNDEFGTFPIYGKNEKSDFVASTHGIKIGINKKLSEKGNEKKLEKALKIMEYLSTEEGQMVFNTGKGDVLPIVGTETSLSPIFEGLIETIDKGHTAPFLYPGFEDVIEDTGRFIKDVCYNSINTLPEVFDLIDRLHEDTLNNKSNYLATVTETLDERQTAKYVANALQAQGYGDFSLVSLGKYSRYFDVSGGANGKLYKGGIVTLAANLPLTNLAAQETVVLALTGEYVLELLENGRILGDAEGHTDSFEYFSSGLDITRDKTGKIIKVEFNGAELEDETIYNVVFSPGDYNAETRERGIPVGTGVTWEKAYLEYIKKIGTITPEHAK